MLFAGRYIFVDEFARKCLPPRAREDTYIKYVHISCQNLFKYRLGPGSTKARPTLHSVVLREGLCKRERVDRWKMFHTVL